MIVNADTTEWHLQLTQGGFALTEGQYYTVSFQASSVQPRPITCNVSQAHASWANLGLSRRVDLGPEWKKFSLGFIATASDKDARITFAFGANSTTFYLAQVELHPGGQMGLVAGESASAGNVSLFQENESTPRILDRMVFLGETEKSLFRRHALLHQEGPGLRRLGHRDDRLRAAGPVRPERHGLHRQPFLLAAPALPRPAVGLDQLAHRAKAHDGPSGPGDALSTWRPSVWPASLSL